VLLDGLHADSATTVPVGEISEDAEKLLDATRASLDAGIKASLLDNHVGDIGHAVQTVAEAAGFSVVRDLVGHGIGSKFHEEPQVPNFGQPKRGARLVAGMTIAIEPMVNIGGHETRTMDDNWTIVTADGSLSAHFEHTVVIGPDGPRILTIRD
jgi:methionyl aminopeptidase